jgi:hypothetical protein
MVALPNQSGMMQFEISECVMSFLDWVFLYIRAHLSCVLEVDVKDSLSRVREGYEARGVSSGLYKTCMALVAKDRSVNEIVFEATMRMMQSAMPLSEVSLLCLCVFPFVGLTLSFLLSGGKYSSLLSHEGVTQRLPCYGEPDAETL